MHFKYQTGRRYDLDWLRIIAFSLLILYHIGMYYVTWDWHVKSAYAGTGLEPVMRLLNPWRLLLLFFISGLAARFMLDKVSGEDFAMLRLWRLFIPLFIGMQFVVAPQTYFQFLQAGLIEPGFWDFFAKYSDPDYVFKGTTTPTWNHLWYVAYLLVYSFILVGIAPWLQMLANGPVGRLVVGLPNWVLALVLPLIPLLLTRFILTPHWPTSHNLIADWANHASSFSMFLAGYLVAKSPAFWQAIHKMRICSLLIAIVLIVPLSLIWLDWDGFVTTYTEDSLQVFAARFARVAYAWIAIATILGFAQIRLNKPGKVLGYLTSVIFPYYILHQTLIIVIASFLAPYQLAMAIEITALIIGTIAGCVLLTEFVIARVSLLRVCFGMQTKAD
ncbi:inner membrane protein [hydrothermal vent metagenome]|uniref:Inner membrane protein n=1 Tax=hydrothermal vent metagenome TaxID=652676 RepID=A0A3B0RSY5_9ZZZZ